MQPYKVAKIGASVEIEQCEIRTRQYCRRVTQVYAGVALLVAAIGGYGRSASAIEGRTAIKSRPFLRR